MITRKIVDLGDGCAIIESATDGEPFVTLYGRDLNEQPAILCFAGHAELSRLVVALSNTIEEFYEARSSGEKES